MTVDKLAINDYQLEEVGHSNTTAATQLGPRSVLRLEIQVSCDWSSCCRPLIGWLLQLRRTLGAHLLRTYCPLVLIVASSWLSFWLVSTPAGTAQYSTVQYSTVHYSTIQYSAVQFMKKY